MARALLKKSLREIERIEGRGKADTIRLWEGYRDQALMWRALTLLQLPITFVALVSALVMYFSADTVIEVPQRPLPGNYSVKELPDAEFIAVATEVVNLVSTYQPTIAKEQFVTTQKYLWEPALTEFEKTMLGDELRAIQETGRSQLFFVDEDLIKVERSPEHEEITVRVPGRRLKLIGNRPVAEDERVFYLTMTTVPRTEHNKHGIVVINIKQVQEDLKTVADRDRGVKLRKRSR